LARDLLAACRPLGIVVLDHVIVSDSGCFSFADSGLLDE
jgi:DNA repair protein RadC